MPQTISPVASTVSYTATADQTAFAVPFEFFAGGDLSVEVDETPADYATVPVGTLQYGVTGAGQTGGGTITFGTGQAAGAEVVITRVLVIQRAANYPTTGPFLTGALNAELNRVAAIEQDLARDIAVAAASAGSVGQTGAPGPDATETFHTTRAAIEAATISALEDDGPTYLLAGGYATVGDAGPHPLMYRRVADDPDLPRAGVRSTDGQWWQLVVDGPIHLGAWGVLADNATDNREALEDWNVWAQAESAAGRAVHVVAPRGTIRFGAGSDGHTWLYGIRTLRFEGSGSTWQNTYNRVASGDNFGKELAWPASARPELRNGNGFLLDTAAIGESGVVLKTPADGANFAVGEWAMVASLDVQYGDYPPNADQFEFHRITDIDTDTGVVLFEHWNQLRYAHRDDFPDGLHSVGKARLWSLDWNQYGTWDLEHEFRGLTINRAINDGVGYLSLTGRAIRLVDCTIPGISPSVCGRFEMIGGETTAVNEPDKLVESILLDGVRLSVALKLQSSSIDRVTLRHCTGDGIQVGQAKYVTIDNCDLAYILPSVSGGKYGPQRALTIRNSIGRRNTFLTPWRTNEPGDTLTVDGTNVTFANGTFAILKASVWEWNCTPGSFVNLLTSAGALASDLGTGIVLSLTEDSTKVYLETTLPYATLPAWASAYVQLHKTGQMVMENCGGEDLLRRASEATMRGHRPGDYYRDTIAGVSSQSGEWRDRYGELVEVRINVVQPAPIACYFTLTEFDVYTPTLVHADRADCRLGVDAQITGQRIVTRDDFLNKQAADWFETPIGNNTDILPRGYWWSGSKFWGYLSNALDPTDYDAWELPVIEVEMVFDRGLKSRPVPALQSHAETLVGLTGQLP